MLWTTAYQLGRRNLPAIDRIMLEGKLQVRASTRTAYLEEMGALIYGQD